MATSYSVSAKNQLLGSTAISEMFVASDKMDVYAGSVPASADAVTSGGTLLGTITLPATPFGTPTGGAVATNGTWSFTATGGSATAPTYFVLRKTADTGTATPATARITGTCGVGSGDISFNGSITSGQTVTVSGSFSL